MEHERSEKPRCVAISTKGPRKQFRGKKEAKYSFIRSFKQNSQSLHIEDGIDDYTTHSMDLRQSSP